MTSAKATTLSRRFVDQFTLILLLFAAVDDVVSESEAGFVNACADSLLALCTKDGLSGDRPPLKADEFITKPHPGAPQPAAPQATEQEPAPEEPAQEERAPALPGGAAGRPGQPVTAWTR